MENTTAALQTFLDTYPVRTYKKGEIVVFQGEAPRQTFVVKSGVIKSYNLSVNGDEKPMSFFTKLDIFPSSWTFKKAPSAYFYYEAFTDCQLYSVPRDDYLKFVRSNPQQLYATMEQLIIEQVGSSMRLNALQHSRASDKLLYTLHYLTLTHGREIEPRVVEIGLSLTHQDFANLTGLTRETTATELNRLKTKGVISYGKHTPYRVNLDKLHGTINDEFIADMQLQG
jgi:CRP/FNR family cyclic AMP-dependent transcriptional regulator